MSNIDRILEFDDEATNKLKKRIKDKVKVNKRGCWVWRGYRMSNSTGDRASIGLFGKHQYGYRVSFVVFKRIPIREKLVCHSCDNPLCVNPDHLWLGNKSTNQLDSIKKGRGVEGERHHFSKLSKNQVLEVRKRYEKGESQADLAREFCVSPGCIHYIIKRTNWKGLK